MAATAAERQAAWRQRQQDTQRERDDLKRQLAHALEQLQLAQNQQCPRCRTTLACPRCYQARHGYEEP